MHTVDVVVPVKPLALAKTRLLVEDRAALVLAMLLDTLGAATAAGQVGRVLVLTADPTIAGLVRAEFGTLVRCADEGWARGLNAAYTYGAQLLGGRRVAALQADLPALTGADLDAAITESADRRAYCADHSGTGTTLLIAAPGGPLVPRFGEGSAARHAGSGAVAVGADRAALRRDVDTEADLDAAAELGLGRHTATARRASAALR